MKMRYLLVIGILYCTTQGFAQDVAKGVGHTVSNLRPLSALPPDVLEDFVRSMRVDLDRDIPLKEAIERANEKHNWQTEPLTEAEVIATIRVKLNFGNMPPEVQAVYQRVVDERVLPRGMYFGEIRRYVTTEYQYEVDWRDLHLRALPPGSTDPKFGKGYSLRIRQKYVSSRELTEDEKQAEKRAQQVNSETLAKFKKEQRQAEQSE